MVQSAVGPKMLDSFSPEHLNFTISQVLLNLLLSFALAFLAATLYRRTHTGPSSMQSFYVTLLVVPVVVCMIMMAIGSNVALSLGLVGALSIIRFRTVIKDTRDMSFLFLMIGIGLCCGSGGYALAIVGTVFVCGVLLVVSWSSSGRPASAEYILVFREQTGRGAEDAMADLSWRKLHGVSDLGPDEGCEYTYRVRLGKGLRPETLISRLRNAEGVSQTALISPETSLVI